MRSIGIVRKIDELGRIVLPKELRTSLGIDEGDPMEIFVDGSTIMLKKYEPSCMFCGEAREVMLYKGKNICRECMNDFKK